MRNMQGHTRKYNTFWWVESEKYARKRYQKEQIWAQELQMCLNWKLHPQRVMLGASVDGIV